MIENRLSATDIGARLAPRCTAGTINTPTDQLIELALEGGARRVANSAAIATETGAFTGRSAKDKYIVRDATTEETVWWANSASLSPAQCDLLLADMLDEAERLPLHRQQLCAGADTAHRLGVDIFTPSAWHALFIRHLLIRPDTAELEGFSGDVSMVHLPDFEADPARHGTRTSTAIVLDLTRNLILICGTRYAGEMKKSVFSLFNFHAPHRNVLPMHCSANAGADGDTALFFGLSGTGKTTLSTSADRALIGDDEHGWSDEGIFNLEGGCYAKAIDLSAEGEPEIYAAAHSTGAILENVVLGPDNVPDFADGSKTENTRIAYPLEAIPNRVETGVGATPRNVIFLAADAFGVLPPIARLDGEQAARFFLAGYTAKLAGTERGVTEPQATFSACFGAPFMARPPQVYADMLVKRLEESGAAVWLVNTGWSGGGYGVGSRMPLKVTRRLVQAALNGEIAGPWRTDPNFGIAVPETVAGVEAAMLDPRSSWEDGAAYDAAARKLVDLFAANERKLKG